MKSVITSIVLVLALPFLIDRQAERTLAIGAKGDAVQQDSTKDENQHVRNQGKKTGDDISSRESGTDNSGKSSPKKKPRLKFRDEPGCSC